MSDFTEKLIEIQKELKAPKGQYNSFGKYKYRSAEDILEAVKPLNAKHGLLLTLSDEPIMVGEWHYIKATAMITDGQIERVVTAYARESENKKGMDHSQITGTASSYARKYALNGLYLIDDTKDADTDEYQNQNNKGGSITPKQVGEIKTKALQLAQLRKATPDDAMKALKIRDVTEITKEHADEAIKKLDEWIEKAQKEGA